MLKDSFFSRFKKFLSLNGLTVKSQRGWVVTRFRLFFSIAFIPFLPMELLGGTNVVTLQSRSSSRYFFPSLVFCTRLLPYKYSLFKNLGSFSASIFCFSFDGSTK